MEQIWIVIDYKGSYKEKVIFDIKGAFDSEEKAKKACKKHTHGYGMLNINEELPDEKKEWPGFVYPNLEDI